MYGAMLFVNVTGFSRALSCRTAPAQPDRPLTAPPNASSCRASANTTQPSTQQQTADDDNADLEGIDATERALSRFECIDKSIYVRVSTDASKHEESIPCDCRYNPDVDPRSQACGESSDCINRLVQMECNPLTCPCGSYCLNRRFQKHQYAKVRVIDAGRKGFGIQALEDLDTGAFVMEYMGEVVTDAEYHKRTRVYQTEGIQHHYFMSIGNGKVIDATRKGCLARFINHSCGPNCVLRKWMVGGAVRLGIFVERPIKRGEEITFDYKFERLADSEPQPCYCGSPVCKGIIGVTKERQLRNAEGAGADDAVDSDIADIDDELEGGAMTRHQRDDIRRRHAAVDDEDYGASDAGYSGSEDEDSDIKDRYGRTRGRERKGLTSPEQVLKFVQIMHRSSRQKRIIEILIGKLRETSDRRLLKSLIGLQGAAILRAWLQDYADDDVMMIKILQCIAHMPISTRNTIEESRLEEVVKPLASYSDENVSSMARELVEQWSSLRHVFKIPKKIRKESAAVTPALSSRQSPTRAASATPDNSSRVAGDQSAIWTNGSARWRNGSAGPQPHMRSASPLTQDASVENNQPFHRQNGQGWDRNRDTAAFRRQSPGSSMRFNNNRSPGRLPYSEFRQQQRVAQNMSRSRSPSGFRRVAPIPRFGRANTGDRMAVSHPHTPYNGLNNSEFAADRASEQGSFSSQRGYEQKYQHQRQQRPRPRFTPWGEPNFHPAVDSGSENTTYQNGDRHAATHYDSPKATSTDSAPRLAPGWLTAYTKDGLTYYYHETTKQTQWQPPLAEPSHAPSETASAAGAPNRRSNFGNGSLDTGYSNDSRWRHSARDSRMHPASQTTPTERWASDRTDQRVLDTPTAEDASIGRMPRTKVDDIVERTRHLDVQPMTATQKGGKHGASQLVTPETDGEPATNGSAASHAASAASVLPDRKVAGASGNARRPSHDGSEALRQQPPAKREKLEKKATSELASFVVREMSKFKSQVGHDEFKHEARKITKILMEKERKADAFDPLKLIDLSHHKKTKIKQFVTDYMTKLVARQPSVTGANVQGR
ncbi:hypothetical protein H4R20_001174 [Coemansia guatemalensis]|uniref:[histone H3]-lysine(36) N-trimethyltransferase n=1 Tax=Coemansia guatemalensis TaxID=2761395 RepID=A0A9W8LUS3_9FUNG|nr:hypothetical protein H4R20_001174 [Coemansia guatemalensis]